MTTVPNRSDDSPARRAPTAPRRILVVDDDASVRHALADVLVGEGYVIVSAGGGLQAVALAASRPVDLVLLDINLLGQNGWDTFRELTAAHPGTPIIVITAKPDQVAQARRVGADALMEKPLNLPVLLQTIDHFLHESDAQRSRRRRQSDSATRVLTTTLPRDPWRTIPESAHGPDRAPAASELGRTDSHEHGGQERILVIAPDTAVRQMLRRILAGEGYATSELNGLPGAGDVAVLGAVDLAVIDLPPGASPTQVEFQRIGTRHPALPVILLTDQPPRDGRGRSGPSPVVTLAKPYDFPTLLRIIKTLVSAPQHLRVRL